MKRNPRKILKKIAWVTLVLLLIWIVFKVRLTVLGLYVALGMHAPVSIRYECAKQADSLVHDKFQLPLAFDQASKDGLREFWHYSFYTGCLQNHGYDHYGNPVPRSSVTDTEFINAFGAFALPIANAKILSDNQVDVAYDDRLILSEIVSVGKTYSVGWYKKFDPMTLDEYAKQWTHFPHTEEPLTIASASGVLTATNSAGLSGCMRYFKDVPFVIFGNGVDPKSCTKLIQSVRTL